MHYTMHYEPEKDTKYPCRPANKNQKVAMKIVCILLVFLLLAAIKWRDEVIAWLIPGDDQLTVQALEEFLIGVRDGVPVGEAVVVFCEEIVSHGA